MIPLTAVEFSLYRSSHKGIEMAGKQSEAMSQAQKLVTIKGISPPLAAKRTGITVNSIYRAAWYKAHIAAKAVQS